MPFIETKQSASIPEQEMGATDRLFLELTSLDHAPIFLIPGIHGNHRELKILAEQLLLKSGGTQKIFIYEDPFFMILDGSKAANYIVYESAEAHATAIAANLMEHYKRSGTLIPPLILGFSYGAMLAQYVVEALAKSHPELSPLLIALDGGAHALLKTYHATPDNCINIAYINELLLIVNTAATSAGLKFTQKINEDLINQINNTIKPVRAINYLYSLIQTLNEDSASDEEMNRFTRLIQVVSQNFNAITENKPTIFVLPRVYTLFTDATLLKFNQNKKPEDMKIFGGFENNETPPTNVTDITTDEIRPLTHLELIQEKGAPLVAEAVHVALSATFNTIDKIQARREAADIAWNATKTKHAPQPSTSTSDEEDCTSIFGSLPKKETPAKDELSKPTSPVIMRTSRKREQRQSDPSFGGSSPTSTSSSSSSLYGSTLNSEQSSDAEYENAHSAEESEDENQTQAAYTSPSKGIVSNNASTLYGSKPIPYSSPITIQRPTTPTLT